MTTGQLIKAARQAKAEQRGKELNIPEAALMAGVAPRAWYQLEADENSPTVTTLYKIAHALDCKPSSLVPDEKMAQNA